MASERSDVRGSQLFTDRPLGPRPGCHLILPACELRHCAPQVAERLFDETRARANADPLLARRSNSYNEFVMDGQAAWAALLPGVVEAFLVGTAAGVRDVRDRFAEEYGLEPRDVPTLGFTCDCDEPFVEADVVPFDPCAGGRYRIVG